MRTASAAMLLLLSGSVVHAEVAVTLQGSRSSMVRQNQVARALDLSFLRTTSEVIRFADDGYLVPVSGGPNYAVLADWPYARPPVLGFIELLAGEYRAACGERLVVTSLTRPTRSQPRNASPLSVHPAGMAVDLRVSSRSSCVRWLQSTLLDWEAQGLVDATREYRPPHFHVAVFPDAFEAHLHARAADSVAAAELAYADSVHAAMLAALPPAPLLSAAPAVPPLVGVFHWLGRLLLRV